MSTIKTERHKSTEGVLKAMGTLLKEECAACGLNCEVRHSEVEFWARAEGLEPTYKIVMVNGRRSVPDCPKDRKLKIKKMSKAVRG